MTSFDLAESDVPQSGGRRVSPSSERLKLWVCYFLLTVGLLVPVFLVELPALNDLPNHLSRLHILSAYEDDPALRENYRLDWALVPNLALDAFAALLSPFLSIATIAKLFVALTIVGLLVGVVALHYAVYRKVGLIQTGAVLLIYGQILAWGFVNFLFGLALALIVFAAWIHFDRWSFRRKIVVFSCFSLLIFFSHLLALAIYGFLLVTYEAGRWWRQRYVAGQPGVEIGAAIGLQFVVPFVVWLSGPGGGFDAGTKYLSPFLKLFSLAAPFRFYFELVDVAIILTVIFGLLVARLIGVIRFAPTMWMPFLGLFVVALGMPHLIVSIFGVDQRLFVAAAFVFVAALDFDEKAKASRTVFIVCVGTLFIWRIDSLTTTWTEFNRKFSEFRLASSTIDRGASVLSVLRKPELDHAISPTGSDFSLWHLVSFAVIERSAFVPLTFTTRYQPLKASEKRQRIDIAAGFPLTPHMLRTALEPDIAAEIEDLPLDPAMSHGTEDKIRYWRDWPEDFDYVTIVDYGDHRNPLPERLNPLHVGSFFVIYATNPRSP